MPKYNSWSEYLKGDSLFQNALRLQALIRMVLKHAKPGAHLLEVGFGSGNTAVLLGDLGYRVTMLDIEAKLIDRFQARFPGFVRLGRIQIVHGNMSVMPFADQSFDLVYHQGVLEHLSDTQIMDALREQARIGRIVVLDVPNDKYADQPYGDERLLSKRTWLQFIREAGLQVVECSGRRFPRWMYTLPHGVFLPPVADRLGLGKQFGMVSIFVCQSLALTAQHAQRSSHDG